VLAEEEGAERTSQEVNVEVARKRRTAIGNGIELQEGDRAVGLSSHYGFRTRYGTVFKRLQVPASIKHYDAWLWKNCMAQHNLIIGIHTDIILSTHVRWRNGHELG